MQILTDFGVVYQNFLYRDAHNPPPKGLQKGIYSDLNKRVDWVVDEINEIRARFDQLEVQIERSEDRIGRQ